MINKPPWFKGLNIRIPIILLRGGGLLIRGLGYSIIQTPQAQHLCQRRRYVNLALNTDCSCLSRIAEAEPWNLAKAFGPFRSSSFTRPAFGPRMGLYSPYILDPF